MVNRISSLLLLACALLGPTTAVADRYSDYEARNGRIDCKRTRTQAEETLCAERDYERAATKLAMTYKSLSERYDAQNRDWLRKSQEKWLAYRDTECDFENVGSTGGTIHSERIDECLTRETALRTTRLREQLNCNPDADLSCNAP